MYRRFSVHPLDPMSVSERHYDLVICSLGYESRASHAAKTLNPNSANRKAFAFDFSRELSYEANAQWYSDNDYEVIEATDIVFKDRLIHLLNALPKDTASILIDVSSFSRFRIATLLCSILKSTPSLSDRVALDVIYSSATYIPPQEDGAPMISAGPVIADLAGLPGDPQYPTSCIIGLGYDEGKAIGAVEYLESGRVWLFRPLGFDPDFLSAVNRSNADILSQVVESRVFDYRLADPAATYRNLVSIISGAARDSRPVLLPFGPKIFFACASLAAIACYPEASVWRVTAGHLEGAVDRTADGNFCGIEVRSTNF